MFILERLIEIRYNKFEVRVWKQIYINMNMIYGNKERIM